jgi:hypothetical protein
MQGRLLPLMHKPIYKAEQALPRVLVPLVCAFPQLGQKWPYHGTLLMLGQDHLYRAIAGHEVVHAVQIKHADLPLDDGQPCLLNQPVERGEEEAEPGVLCWLEWQVDQPSSCRQVLAAEILFLESLVKLRVDLGSVLGP